MMKENQKLGDVRLSMILLGTSAAKKNESVCAKDWVCVLTNIKREEDGEGHVVVKSYGT